MKENYPNCLVDQKFYPYANAEIYWEAFINRKTERFFIAYTGSKFQHNLLKFTLNRAIQRWVDCIRAKASLNVITKAKRSDFLMDNEKTGKLISSIRKDKGLTQKQLADSLGVSNATISKWETGKGFPDISLLEPLASVLDVTVSEVLAGERRKNNDETNSLINDLVEISVKEQNRKIKVTNWIIAITVALLYISISVITQKWEYTWVIWLVYCLYRTATEFIVKRKC